MEAVTEIGTVENGFADKADPVEMRKHESQIVLHDEYVDGLFRIGESAYIQVIFGFHLSGTYSLRGPVYTGETKGVFASRSPNRPNRLGVTTAELLRVEGKTLTVRGLDAVDGSPVYDIKPYAPIFDDEERTRSAAAEWTWSNPRSEIVRLIRSKSLLECLTVAGKLHGHYCPGLALGVYASVEGMNRMFHARSDGMERLLAITEVNSCFSDGVQVVTGCTFGNNALIYADYGKTAVTLATRADCRGIRISVKPGFRELLQRETPGFSSLFEKVVKQRSGTESDMAAFKVKARETALKVLSYPANTLFELGDVSVQIPPYAPIVESLVCDQCGEQMMETKAVRDGQKLHCRACRGNGAPRVTGAGIET